MAKVPKLLLNLTFSFIEASLEPTSLDRLLHFLSFPQTDERRFPRFLFFVRSRVISTSLECSLIHLSEEASPRDRKLADKGKESSPAQQADLLLPSLLAQLVSSHLHPPSTPAFSPFLVVPQELIVRSALLQQTRPLSSPVERLRLESPRQTATFRFLLSSPPSSSSSSSFTLSLQKPFPVPSFLLLRISGHNSLYRPPNHHQLNTKPHPSLPPPLSPFGRCRKLISKRRSLQLDEKLRV